MWQAAGFRAKRIANTGLIPQSGFGVAITGLSDKDLDEMRRIAEAAAGGRRKGCSLERRRLLEGDPAGELAAAPILEWAKEVRAARRRDLGACSGEELAAFWEASRRRAPKRWADSRGPVDVVRLSLRRLGWSWPTPWTMRSDQGTGLDVRTATPKLLEWNLRQTHRRQLEQQVCKAMARRGWEGCGRAVSSMVPRRL